LRKQSGFATQRLERRKMARPVTLFTGQWADLSLEELAPLTKEMGYDGLELACWGTTSRWIRQSKTTVM
jgi:hypothetical protein